MKFTYGVEFSLNCKSNFFIYHYSFAFIIDASAYLNNHLLGKRGFMRQ